MQYRKFENIWMVRLDLGEDVIFYSSALIRTA